MMFVREFEYETDARIPARFVEKMGTMRDVQWDLQQGGDQKASHHPLGTPVISRTALLSMTAAREAPDDIV